MKKFILLTVVSLICESLLAYEEEDYVSSLQWKEKWNKVTTQAADRFVDRGKAYYPSSFTVAQTEQAAKLIKSSLVQKIGWKAMKTTVVSAFRDNCGDELLDLIVELQAGVEYSVEDRQLLANEYGRCATLSMKNAMNDVREKIEDFTTEERRILSEVSSK